MKLPSVLMATIAVAAVSIPFVGETDPFGVRTAMHQLTSMSPRVAYASTPELMGEDATSEMRWISTNDLHTTASNKATDIVCKSSAPGVSEHPYYKKWCSN